MSQQAENIAIVHRSHREQITFASAPPQELTAKLRVLGFDYDRRNRQWFREHLGSAVYPISEVANEFSE